MRNNILEYLEDTVKKFPYKVAFSTGGAEEDANLTFGELYRLSRGVGSYIASLGVCHEPVVVYMEKHPKEVAAFFGSVYGGCFYVPIDSEMPRRRVELIFENLHPRICICDASTYEIAKEIPSNGNAVLFDDISSFEVNDSALTSIREKQIDTDPIYIVFTSGSTGIPKGVAACHRSVLDYIETLSETLGFSSETVFANQTPLYFDAPLKELMPTIKFGATTYFVPKKLFMFPVKLVDYLNEHHVNTVCWVVSALTMISSFGVLEKNPPKYLKTVAFGSEVFPVKQFNLWRSALPQAVFFNLYGPTECTGMSCWYKADGEFDTDAVIPIGRPFRNTEILLITDEKKKALPGELGEIYIRGTCVTLGYFNDPAKTAEAFVQNPLQSSYPETVYRTGDIAKYNDKGELVFVSRRDSQIKHMGHRIELGEIEAAACAAPGITRACCLYDSANKRIVLVYTGEEQPVGLINSLKRMLPRYMIPARCEKLDVFPLTPNGKIDRRLLKETYTEAPKINS